MTVARPPAPDVQSALRRRLRRLAATIALTTLLASAGLAAATGASAETCANPVSCENLVPGAEPEEWDLESGAGDPSIQGFATDISVDVGNRIDFKIDTDAAAYTIDVYRTGWYQGLGARKWDAVEPSADLPQHQPECIPEGATELYDCGSWAVSASWDVPSNAVSGVYIALLTRGDTGGRSHITFVVRDSVSTSDILFQTSDTTWHAYNTYGGASFYQGGANGRAYKLSYNRPFSTREGTTARDFYFASEYPMVRFLERNGYDVSYASGVDTARFGQNLLQHEVFLSVGHDEYWSGEQRSNIEAARDAGVDIQFLGGNVAYWRTRHEPSIDGSSTPYRTLVSYKETWSNAKIDPSAEWTGTWRDPRFASQASGAGRPENALLGTMYMSNYSDLPVTVSDSEGKARLWRNTGLESQQAGTSTALAPHTVGYESDEDLDNGHRPPGLIRLSTTVGSVPEYLQDFGNVVAPGETEHHVTLYRAPSGALVFSSGSVQWSWGLDETHDGDGAPADPRMQQAEVNLLADMGAQAATLQSDLEPAVKSTDTTPPTVEISAPASGANVANGSSIEISGTASDVGGVVAGVEVSTDGGGTWHPAVGASTWSYEFIVHRMGDVAVQVRAIDDSANYPATGASVAVHATGPYSAFGSEAPKRVDAGDPSPVELGLRFVPTTDGFVQGVRFFKSEANTGTHTGSLWGPDGAQLATGTFANETSSGWQTLTFDTPVPLDAGQTYTASYWAPNGHYAADDHAFSAGPLDRDPLFLPGGFGNPVAGVYGVQGTRPISTWGDTNYFVDVVFETGETSPLSATSRWPLPGSTSVAAGATVSATFTKAVSEYSVAVRNELGGSVAGATAYDAATRTVTFTPAAALDGFVTYTVELSARTASGVPLTSGATWSFRTAKPDAAPGQCPCGIFPESTLPGILEDPDTVPVVLGTAFTPTVDGVVTGVSFYKSIGNAGPHTGSLWTAAGEQLASGAFTSQVTSGWHTLTFDEPVPVTAGTEYVAAYRAPAGRYSATIGAFAAPKTVGPLTTAAGAGAYSYSGDFPASRSTTSYLVDVVFDAAPPSIAVTSVTPAANAVGVDPNADVSVTFNAPIAAGAALTATAGGQSIAGSLALSADGTSLTFDAAAALPSGATVTASFSGATAQSGGGTVPARTWAFTVAEATPDGTVSLLTGATPDVAAAGDDPASVELGMAFTTAVRGEVLGVRFHKGAGNVGTHTGSLWDATTGAELASVTFADESSTGWQQALFDEPVEILPGREYVVSYLAPNGHYSYTPGFFATSATSGPLIAPADVNGRYRYGDGTAIPAFSWNRTNYFVDVVFDPADTVVPPAVTSSSPIGGATLIATSTAVSAVLTGDIASPPQLALTGPNGAVAGSSTWNAASSTLTFTPAAALAGGTGHTATVTIGGQPVADGEWTFTTVDAAPIGAIFDDATPTNTSWNDATAVQLGVRFSVTEPVSVACIRFFKVQGDSATSHQVLLWGTDTGNPITTAVSSDETASGWQTVRFDSAVELTPGVEYRATYLTTTGRYAADVNALIGSVQSGPFVTVPGGGVYVYSSGASYPWSTAGHNYWADVVLAG
ncbi:DUF4082 domain-containing protein [Agromyces badenianii]|uniref:DUF4082 domain-containing protein n=1 Tax=Agromyces badenianii TaxID=2080742 RepID=UPI00105A9DCD|nr:DUF4082 domain-containing protein [Agromyces badenianii]